MRIYLKLWIGLVLLTLTLGATESQAGLYYQGPFEMNLDHVTRESANVYLPKEYDHKNTEKKWPLVLLLHGYAATGNLQDIYFGMSHQVSTRGFVLLVPEGTPDKKGKKFWNATESCCNFDHAQVNDVDYLLGLLSKTKEKYSIDASRVYIIGHSNGGFMAHRLACEYSELFAGIASLAGASYKDPQKCHPREPVSMLQIHAEDDSIIHYQGGAIETVPYPSATETVEQWTKNNGCDRETRVEGPFDFIRMIPGEDTTLRTWTHCENQTQVALWTIKPYSCWLHSPHIPWIRGELTTRILDFLWAHSK